jgi:hypothetical protein
MTATRSAHVVRPYVRAVPTAISGRALSPNYSTF